MLIKIVLIEVSDGETLQHFQVGIDQDLAIARYLESDARFNLRAAEGFWSSRYKMRVLRVEDGAYMKHGEVKRVLPIL